VPRPRLCLGVRIRLVFEGAPAPSRERVRALVCRVGGTQRVPLPPDIRAKELAETRTHELRRRTPGINPGAHGALSKPNALFRLIPKQSVRLSGN